MNVCFCDLDGTLLDSDYNLNCPEEVVRETIGSYQAQSGFVGLNSDTPVPTLEYWAERLGMRGPIIAEYGGVIHWPEYGLFSIPAEQVRIPPRESVINILQAEFPTTHIIAGDVNRISRARLETYTRSETAILVNALRTRSISLFTRTKNPSSFIDDVTEVLRRISPVGCAIESDRSCGFVSVRSATSNKSTGLRLLTELVGGLDEITMIGNTTADFIVSSQQVVQAAVQNANDDYKRWCSIVSAGTLTQGCVQIITALTEARHEKGDGPPAP